MGVATKSRHIVLERIVVVGDNCVIRRITVVEALDEIGGILYARLVQGKIDCVVIADHEETLTKYRLMVTEPV